MPIGVGKPIETGKRMPPVHHCIKSPAVSTVKPSECRPMCNVQRVVQQTENQRSSSPCTYINQTVADSAWGASLSIHQCVSRTVHSLKCCQPSPAPRNQPPPPHSNTEQTHKLLHTKAPATQPKVPPIHTLCTINSRTASTKPKPTHPQYQPLEYAMTRTHAHTHT